MDEGLNSDANWFQVFNGNYAGIIDPESQKTLPIETIKFPVTFTKPFIRLFCKSTSAKPIWYKAGNLFQLLKSESGLDFIAEKNWLIPLNNLQLIQVPVLTIDYQLKFKPAKWLKQIAIVIEE